VKTWVLAVVQLCAGKLFYAAGPATLNACSPDVMWCTWDEQTSYGHYNTS